MKDKYPCVLITLDHDFNKDYDGIRKNGRNSREGLGYLTVEEYYDFFYDLDINDYDLETIYYLMNKYKYFQG